MAAVRVQVQHLLERIGTHALNIGLVEAVSGRRIVAPAAPAHRAERGPDPRIGGVAGEDAGSGGDAARAVENELRADVDDGGVVARVLPDEIEVEPGVVRAGIGPDLVLDRAVERLEVIVDEVANLELRLLQDQHRPVERHEARCEGQGQQRLRLPHAGDAFLICRFRRGQMFRPLAALSVEQRAMFAGILRQHLVQFLDVEPGLRQHGLQQFAGGAARLRRLPVLQLFGVSRIEQGGRLDRRNSCPEMIFVEPCHAISPFFRKSQQCASPVAL